MEIYKLECPKCGPLQPNEGKPTEFITELDKAIAIAKELAEHMHDRHRRNTIEIVCWCQESFAASKTKLALTIHILESNFLKTCWVIHGLSKLPK